MRDRPVVQEVDDRCNRRSQRSLRLSFRNPWPVRASRTRHGCLRDQREVEGVGVTFALVLEAVLVPPAALADALRPSWTLLAEIALLRHQLTVLQRSVTRPRVTRFARPRSLGPSAPDWPRVRSLNRRCVNTLSVSTCALQLCPRPWPRATRGRLRPSLLAGPRPAPSSRRSCGLHRRLLPPQPTRNARETSISPPQERG